LVLIAVTKPQCFAYSMISPIYLLYIVAAHAEPVGLREEIIDFLGGQVFVGHRGHAPCRAGFALGVACVGCTLCEEKGFASDQGGAKSGRNEV